MNPAPSSDTGLSRGQWGVLAAAFLAVALSLYANALSNPFHFDDFHGVVDNYHLRDPQVVPKLFGYHTARKYFSATETQARHYRPLLLLSYAANYQLFGGELRGFHLYHVLLHAISALLLVALGMRLGLPPPWAVGAGVFFLANPFNSEAVNYISARSSLQCGTLMFAALYAFVRFRQGRNRGRFGWLGGAVLFSAGALLTKEVAVTLPLLFLLYDLVYPPPREARWGVHGYGLHLAFIAAGTAFLVMQGHLTDLVRVMQGRRGARGVGENLWLQAQAVFQTLRLTLVPAGLSIVHDFPGAARPNWVSAGCGLSLAALTGAAVWYARRLPVAAFGWGMFLIALLPTTLMPLNNPLDESRAYFAGGGIMLAAVAIALALFHRPVRDPRWIGLALLPLALFMGGTVFRNTVWGSDMSLWQDAVAKAPKSHLAHANLGAAFQSRGDYETAVTHYRKAIELFPDEASIHSDLGSALSELGRQEEAIRELELAVKLYPPYAPGHYNLGLARYRSGDIEGARAAYEQAVKLRPFYKEAQVNLGNLLARQGDLEGGIIHMEAALAYDPKDPAIYRNLMLACLLAGRTERVKELYVQAEANGISDPRLRELVRAAAAPPAP